MSKELRDAVISLIKDTKLFQTTEPQISPITPNYNDTEHAELYKALISKLDELMIFMNKEEIATEETLARQREIQRVRHLVLEQTLTTLPILRAIHDVQGIPSREAELKKKVQKRDSLISNLAKNNNDQTTELVQLIHSNIQLLSQVKVLASQIPQTPTPTSSTTLRNKSIKLAEDIYSIIVGLGLDWSEPELQEIVLYCGDIYN